MSEAMITLGAILAAVSENDAAEITSAWADARLIFCFTSESEHNRIIVTPKMRELGNVGFLPIAIARIDPSDPSKYFLFAFDGLSDGLRFALEQQGCDLIHEALSCLADGRDVSRASD